MKKTYSRNHDEPEDGNCFGYRRNEQKPYHWLKYSEVLKRARNFGSGLLHMGLKSGPNTLVGIFSKNCLEWGIFERAMYCYSMVLVPLYDQLGQDACSSILRETEVTLLVVENEDTLIKMLPILPSNIQCIVTINDVSKTTLHTAMDQKKRVVRFKEVEKYGAENPEPDQPPNSGSPAVICFNLNDVATEDNPKGVILSHGNVLSSAEACVSQMEDNAPNEKDVMISYLPLAHILERCSQTAVLMKGGAIGFYSGITRNLTEDIKALRPTIIPAVPRFLNRIYDKVSFDMNSSSFKRTVFNLGLKAKTSELCSGIIRNDGIVDRLLFRSIQSSLGGRVRLVIVGSAPLAGNVLNFIRSILGCYVLEGYGLTECSGCCTLTVPGDYKVDHVGPPIACCAIKLSDVPDLNYFSDHGQGEICIRGPNVFLGYYKDPHKTKTVIDRKGWLHTGDVGQWLPNGTLKIIDRIHHIFKLSQGNYISPNKLERMYMKSKYIEQVFIYGESIKSHIISVVVPNADELRSWASRKSIPSESFSSLCQQPQVKSLILEEIQHLGKEFALKSYEIVEDVYLHPDLFSVQNGLLNFYGNVRRKIAANYFKPQLEDMYQKIG